MCERGEGEEREGRERRVEEKEREGRCGEGEGGENRELDYDAKYISYCGLEENDKY